MQCGDGKENCKNEKLKKKWIRSFSENIDLGLCFIVGVYQYIGYRISLREIKRIIGIQ